MRALASRIVGSAALVLWAGASQAQPAEDANDRARFLRAVTLFERGEHEAALAEFVVLAERVPRPSVLFNLAATYEALRRYPEAADTYARYLAVAPADAPDRRSALRGQQRVAAHVATLDVQCAPAGATVAAGPLQQPCPAVFTVATGEQQVVARWPDGRTVETRALLAAGERRTLHLDAPSPAPTRAEPTALQRDPSQAGELRLLGLPPGATLRVDGALRAAAQRVTLPPGDHRLRVDAPGRVSWEEVLAVTAGAQTLTLDLASPAHGPAPAAFWSVAGVSAAVLLGAAVTGALAVATHGEFASLTRDDPRAAELARRGEGLAVSADVLLVTGLVGAVGAVILGTQTRFTPPRSHATLHAEE
ncbi:MAG: hypothetical protein U0325_26940 [Polyangiales bacterium]